MPVTILPSPVRELCAYSEVFNLAVYPQCFAHWLSQALSAGILAGSLALKLPQIMNILLTGDVVGISPEAFYSEVPLTIQNVLYNYRKGYPFMSYGEAVVVAIQNFLLVLILWRYMKPAPTWRTMTTVLFLFIAVTVGCFVLPENLLFCLPMVGFPLMIYSRMVQIIANYTHRTTGQLSSITTFLIFGGNLARVFTTIQQVGWDWTLISGFGVGAFLSGVLLFQIAYYTLQAKNKDKSGEDKGKTADKKTE